MSMKYLKLFAATSLLASAAVATPAIAGSLRVDPLKVEITAKRKIGSVRVKNDADQPVTIRGYALSWTQQDGQDVHEDTSAIVVSPPVATIPPGGEQLIRVGLRSAAGAPGAYRLIVEEVPEAGPAGGVQVALRLSLPLFAMQAPGTLDDLRWSASRGADGKLVLEAANVGSGYVRIEPADAARITGLGFETKGSLGTILPNGNRRWVMHKEPVVVDRTRFESIPSGSYDGPIQTVSKR
jgi:fimbrial chaperone protein